MATSSSIKRRSGSICIRPPRLHPLCTCPYQDLLPPSPSPSSPSFGGRRNAMTNKGIFEERQKKKKQKQKNKKQKKTKTKAGENISIRVPDGESLRSLGDAWHGAHVVSQAAHSLKLFFLWGWGFFPIHFLTIALRNDLVSRRDRIEDQRMRYCEKQGG
ncbi:hypothetical protein IE53DRAFT_250272 [Violaceomyces palustris]|uniref:Uncharacterized protein n=1 Tax=Violaceomyces palustris TaxID=1673888 RepID=A0ACD0P415_9BASI|nr:hypothetical protein IE53DRAFT_250272 [Violaceomyces palustris]